VRVLKIVEHNSKEEPFGGYTSFMLYRNGKLKRQYNIINTALAVPGTRFKILRILLAK